MAADSFLKALARELAPYLIAELRAANEAGEEWIDQRRGGELMGRNRFCQAVKDRLDRDPADPHARRIGKRYLLDSVGLAEEMERANQRPSVAKAEAPPQVSADPEAATAEHVLRLLQGGA